jgi:hypothetical protein
MQLLLHSSLAIAMNSNTLAAEHYALQHERAYLSDTATCNA